MKRRSFGLAGLCLLLAGGAAQADDVFPPDWRGNFGTMTVGWDFWGPEGSGPRILRKSEGQLIQANPGGFDDAWPAWAYFDSQGYVHFQIQERESVLEINESGTLAFRLSNYEHPLPEKRLLFQITFLQGLGAPSGFWVASWPDDPGYPPWEFPDPVPAIVQDSHDHGGGWQTNSYALLIEPNPRYEGFSIDFTEYPAFIDQVVIDTWCTEGEPECPGDIDGDGDTDHSDLGELLAAWCSVEGDPTWNPDADLDADGHVGHGDLGILLGDWGCGT